MCLHIKDLVLSFSDAAKFWCKWNLGKIMNEWLKYFGWDIILNLKTASQLFFLLEQTWIKNLHYVDKNKEKTRNKRTLPEIFYLLICLWSSLYVLLRLSVSPFWALGKSFLSSLCVLFEISACSFGAINVWEGQIRVHIWRTVFRLDLNEYCVLLRIIYCICLVLSSIHYLYYPPKLTR